MLNIFADALLIVTRQTPRPNRLTAEKMSDAAEHSARRRWYSLTGILL